MNSSELGKKIKEARIARKMTQSEVVGDFITRNMLSQIESGTATPSVKTLGYLSRILEVPFAQLMPDQKEDALLLLDKAKKFLIHGFYDKVLEMETDYPDQLEDEFSAIFSLASLYLSRNFFSEGNFRGAARFAQKSMEYAEKGVYANVMIKSEAIMILNKAAEQLSLGLNAD